MEEVRNWLRGQGLEQYASKFEELGWDSVDILPDMEPGDIKDCIDKPGHRKKFEKGLKINPPTADTPVEKVKHDRSEDTKRDEDNVQTEQKYEAQVGQLITEITYDNANTDRPDQEGACKLHELDTHTIDQSDKEDKCIDNTSIGSALVPYRVSETIAYMDSQEDSSIGESLCTVEYGAVKTVVVRGAQNQLIGIPPDVEPRECFQRGDSMIPDGRIATEEHVRHSKEDDINHIIGTEPPDSLTNEDMTSVLGMEGRAGDHQLVTGAAANMPITSATIVTDSQNVTIAKKAEVYHVHQNAEERRTDNFKDQTSVVVQSYRNKDHLYVETRAFQELKEIVDDRYWATITGRSGDGKTAMAVHLLLQYQVKGYEPVIVLKPHDWKDFVEGIKGKQQYVMIDDMFGGFSVDEIKVNEWLTMIDFMQRVVQERAGQLIVVSTSRKYIFMDVKLKLEFAGFSDTSVLDLTAPEHDLSFAEKKQIWLKYAEEYNIPADIVSDDIFYPDNVFNLDPPHGFPHCVEMYCTNAFLRKQGEEFFENPMQFISQEISCFMENDKLKYCLLLYIFFEKDVLNITKVETDLFSNCPERIHQIIKIAGLAAPPTYSEFQKALKSLLMTYIAECDDGLYCFAHDSIEENVAHVYIENNPLSSIENLDLFYITSYTRCCGYKSESLKPVYVFPSRYTSKLVERIVKEILKGKATYVAFYDAWEDQSFIEKWIDYLQCTLQGRYVKKASIQATFTDIMFTENQDKGCVTLGPNIIEALIYNKREKALISMLAQEEISKQFNADMATKWLMLACESDLGKQFILQLIHTGANVHTIWPESKLKKYTELYMVPGYFKLKDNVYITVYSPLLLAVLRSNEEVAGLLLEQNASIFLSGKADVLIVALVLGKATMVKLIFQFSSKWIRSSPLLKYSIIPSGKMQISEVLGSLCNSRVFLSKKQLGIKSLCALVHLVKDVESLKELLTHGAHLNTDVVISSKRMSHFLFCLFSYTDILLLRDKIRYGMMIKGEWGDLSSLHCFVLACFHYRTSNSINLRIAFPTDFEKMVEAGYFLEEFIFSSSCASLINEKDKQGKAALHHLLEQWNISPMWNGIQELLCKFLLRNNADVNLPNGEGATVVMEALRFCRNVEILQELIPLRKPQLVDNSGRGYLHYLACAKLPENCVQELCLCLLESGEDINLQDYHGNPPVFYSTSVNIHAFINAGANLGVTNNSGENIAIHFLRNGKSEMVKNLISNNNLKVFIHYSDKNGRNIIHYLMMLEEQELANIASKYLPSSCCRQSITSTNHKGLFDSPMPIGRDSNYLLPPCRRRSITSAEYKELFDILISVECDLKLCDSNGVTPLMLAVHNDTFDIEFLQYVVRKCGDIGHVDSMNMSVLHHCLIGNLSKDKQIETVRYLKSHAKDVALISSDLLHFAITQTVCSVEVIIECLNCDEGDYSRDVKAITTDILASSRSVECQINCLRKILAEFDMKITDLFRGDYMTLAQKRDIVWYLVIHNEISFAELAWNKEDIFEIILRIPKEQSAVLFLVQLVHFSNDTEFLFDMQIWKTLCRRNDIIALNFIVNIGIKTNSVDADGNSLLHLVIKYICNDSESVALIEHFIDEHAIMQLQLQNNHLMTPLHIACRGSPIKPQTIHVLITSMDKVDMVDCCGMTALHYICSNINSNSVCCSEEFDIQVYIAFCLILKGANVDHQNFDGQSSLMLAIKNNALNRDLINLLIENTNNVNVSDARGNSALHHLVRASVDDGMKASMLRILIDKGGDTDLENKDGQTAVSFMRQLFNVGRVGLYVYALFTANGTRWNSNDTFCILSKHLSAMKSESSDFIQLFNVIIMKRKFDINIRNPTDSKTLLVIASENVFPTIVRILLSVKADPNMSDMVGFSCLIKLLTSNVLARMSVLQICLIGASTDAHNFWNYAVNNRDLLYLNVSRKTVTAFEYECADGEEACCRKVSEDKARALDLLEALLSYGADPNKTDITGKTVLHHYVASPVSDMFICPAMRQLLQCGADVNARDHDGMTPLMACSQFEGRKARRMNILLDSGANIFDTDNFGGDSVEYGKMAFGTMFLLN